MGVRWTYQYCSNAIVTIVGTGSAFPVDMLLTMSTMGNPNPDGGSSPECSPSAPLSTIARIKLYDCRSFSVHSDPFKRTAHVIPQSHRSIAVRKFIIRMAPAFCSVCSPVLIDPNTDSTITLPPSKIRQQLLKAIGKPTTNRPSCRPNLFAKHSLRWTSKTVHVTPPPSYKITLRVSSSPKSISNRPCCQMLPMPKQKNMASRSWKL